MNSIGRRREAAVVALCWSSFVVDVQPLLFYSIKAISSNPILENCFDTSVLIDLTACSVGSLAWDGGESDGVRKRRM
jgi:hypothetical protein